jgi:hypothetical protein
MARNLAVTSPITSWESPHKPGTATLAIRKVRERVIAFQLQIAATIDHHLSSKVVSDSQFCPA